MWIKTPEGRMINMNHVSVFSKYNDEWYDETNLSMQSILSWMTVTASSVIFLQTTKRKETQTMKSFATSWKGVTDGSYLCYWRQARSYAIIQ